MNLRSLLTGALLGVCCLSVAPAPADAGKDDDTLNFVWRRDPQTLDFYNVLESSGLTLGVNVWDTLIYTNTETGEFEPLLAATWEWISPTELRFTLRKDVTFHNGEPFNADDVVYTVDMVTDKDNPVINQQMVAWIDRAEKIDDYTVSIFLKKPFAAALAYLAIGVPIYPNEYGAAVGKEGMATEPVGTGPYKVVSFEAGKQYTLEKWDGYFDGVKPKATIGTVVLRTLKDAQLRVAELMGGTADMAWDVDFDQAKQMDQMPNLTFRPVGTMRTQFLVLEPNGMKGPHPLTDIRVRQAIAHAINREAIVDNLLSKGSELTDVVCHPGMFGCVSDAEAYAYDPEEARRLLAEAGFADGFTVEMWETSSHTISEAIAGDLRNVGITANLHTVTWPAMYDAWTSGESLIAQSSTTHWSIKDVSITMSAYFGGNPQDIARDEELHALIDQANESIDPEERKAIYSQALARITENVYWVPLWNLSNNYVLNSDLDFTGAFDEIIRFNEASWK
ncbi:ABC transporter substrate-binding protein [Pukyongiella litopenaei]|uniref:ABC transporter substrate-binding protein n=1 Tax=Pukyongiella litopenaei TaxID=2605946 RepID=A0A5C2H8F6_9RHOB|nr:ABC transporter substrate-binding protein [Pukyongiella litopenaei]QEP30641.1 ABC transporter substrate-binding protein [Pukyongiella litopenaei]